MKYDFDEIISREGTNCYKHEYLMDICGRTDVLPMWVADMEFRTPDFVLETIQKRLAQGILGYTCPSKEYYDAICRWNSEQYGLEITREMINYIPGVVSGIYMAMLAFTEKRDRILIMDPVYHPFRLTPEGNKREVLLNPLAEQADGSYKMDFEQLQQLIAAEPKAKLLILSNPHNPAGILWDKATLQQLAHICASNNILVISDEIHCDMALWGKQHIPFASVSEEAAQCSITFGAPSKTFNIAGIVSSYTVVPNDSLRDIFFRYLDANEYDSPTIMSVIAAEAAYTYGHEWRKQMLDYVQGNIDYVDEYLRKFIPQLHCVKPDASFLVWLDCRKPLRGQVLRSVMHRAMLLSLSDGVQLQRLMRKQRQ